MSPAAQLERERRRAGGSAQAGGHPAVDDGDAELQSLVRRMLELLGEEPDRAGLLDTPRRVAKAMRWLTRGYGTDAEGAIAKGIFEERHDSLVQ